MTFDKIMMEITNGLTGDKDHDIPYLQEQSEKYKNHESAKEILRACGRIMFNYLSEEQKKEISQTLDKQDLAYDSVLEEVRFKQYQKKYDEALVLMESLVGKCDKEALFQDDSVSEYHCFYEFFEEALYRFYNKPEKDIRQASIPFDEIYLQYGSLLIDLKRFEAANKALEKALHWDPANANIAFEYAETFKLMGNIEAYFHQSLHIFRYAFRPKQVAHCYRNMGYYFIEKGLWKEAVSCYTLSLQFEKDSKNAMSELYFIHEKAGNIEPASHDEMHLMSEKYGFPIGAHEDVIGVAFAYGKKYLETNNIDAAKYCWQIAYDLTNDEGIKKILDSLTNDS